MQRRIDAFLDQAEAASDAGDWQQVAEKARAALAIDTNNEDAATFLQMAVANGISESASSGTPNVAVSETPSQLDDAEPPTSGADPESFAGGRYHVQRFLGEGGKKRVFLAHDGLLDRDIAFSLIKTEGLDETGRERIMREAQAMGRLTHPNIVAIYDIGEHVGADGTTQPYLVQELMGGGDVEGLLEDAEDGLPLKKALDISIATARGLEFAHAEGVVHRDLKPGNVWLTADGIAKIGDLGLAVTLGQSRLTTHGMMVGTYGYMPPEQALGQDVTAQADLYSFGAMLYELVTGQPPFEGDTPTAVISQHLNTQPVAPSWHSDRCPPDLEALILRLLAKVPADRPPSATEVIAALEAVDPDGVSVSHSDSGSNPLDRLARGVFVGRENELERLRSSLDAAIEGRGSVVMVVGEPGIGKTRTVQELETYARMRGAGVYWGRTHESAGMPAYWPWQQVGRAWGAQRDLAASGLAANLNPEMLRLFPELRQVLPGLPEPGPVAESDSAQFLLFDAYTQFMRAQSAEQPWVVVLDDLHWADRPTLQLLQFIARELTNMGVLVVGTYRDTDLVRTHPLSETLAELNREGGFQRIVLKGLDSDEVATYVRQRASIEPSTELTDRLYEETEGNPFFLSEMVNLMVDEGTLDSTSVSDMALPDGVREALGRRLDRLSEEASELLQVAAIVGREFAHETLNLLSEHEADELLRLIEEGLRARVIEETARAGRYRFTHALMQETLLDELSTTRRVRLHGLVAEALERRWGDRADTYATRLALHYAESATLTPAHSEKAARYLELAAAEAEEKSAWPSAAEQLERAAELLEERGQAGNEMHRCGLLTAAGKAYRRSVQPRAAWRCLMRAAELARQAEDGIALARVALEVATGFLGSNARTAAIGREALELLGDQDPELRIALLATLVGHRAIELDDPEGKEAMSVERAELPTLVQANLLRADAWQANQEKDNRRTAALFQQAAELFESTGAAEAAAHTRANRLFNLGFIGEFDVVLNEIERLTDYCEPRNLAFPLRVANGVATGIHVLRANFEALKRVSESRYSDDFYVPRALAARALIIADLDTAATLVPATEAAGGNPQFVAQIVGLRARIHCLRGEVADAAEDLERWLELTRSTHGGIGMEAVVPDEALILLDDDTRNEVFESLSQAVQDSERLFYEHTSLTRVLGQLAQSLGRPDEAQRLLTEASQQCSEHRCPIELGRCQLGLALIAEESGDGDAAREHLDVAGESFLKHGAKLYLDQVIAKKEILKA